MLGSRKREKTKVKINFYPMEAHSLQRRHENNFPKMSFKVGDFIFHNNTSKLIQTCASIANNFATVFPCVAEAFATLFPCVAGFLPPRLPVSINNLAKTPEAISTCLWHTKKAICSFKYYILTIPWCQRLLKIHHPSKYKSLYPASICTSSKFYVMKAYLYSFMKMSFH